VGHSTTFSIAQVYKASTSHFLISANHDRNGGASRESTLHAQTSGRELKASHCLMLVAILIERVWPRLFSGSLFSKDNVHPSALVNLESRGVLANPEEAPRASIRDPALKAVTELLV